MTPDDRRSELVERVAKAIYECWCRVNGVTKTSMPWEEIESDERDITIAEAAAAINLALEEAARVAEAFPAFTHGNLAIAPERVAGQVAGEIAAAIRALKGERH